jgi:hypothetical protein
MQQNALCSCESRLVRILKNGLKVHCYCVASLMPMTPPSVPLSVNMSESHAATVPEICLNRPHNMHPAW